MADRLDKCVITIAVFYVALPIVLFLFGWTRIPIAVLASALLIYLSIKLPKSIEIDESITITNNVKFWLTALVMIALWVLFSGIGNFSYQTVDFVGRNPMFRDLQMYSWPVRYDLSLEPDRVKAFIGDTGFAMYVYYFTWWLPAAFFARCLYFLGLNNSLVEILANCALYLWAVLGLFLTFYCLVRYLKKYSYWILSAFILFGGFDFLAYLVINMNLPVNTQIEWWAGGSCNYFQYSANTTQLFWVFNQSIPVWLILSVLLLLKDNKGKAGWASLCFAYSPYATIGMIPIAIASIMNRDGRKMKDRIMSAISIENIFCPVMMVIVFGLFYYLDLPAATDNSGFIFSLDKEFRTFTIYVAFVIVEFLIYFYVMGRTAFKYNLYWVVMIELLIFPLYRSGMKSDFTMRASIPALFILMVMCLQYLFEMKDTGNKKKYRIMMVCLGIGYLVSCTEIQRNVSKTFTESQGDYIKEEVYSFGNMQTEDEAKILLNVNQYMVIENDMENSWFYKLLLKK